MHSACTYGAGALGRGCSGTGAVQWGMGGTAWDRWCAPDSTCTSLACPTHALLTPLSEH